MKTDLQVQIEEPAQIAVREPAVATESHGVDRPGREPGASSGQPRSAGLSRFAKPVLLTVAVLALVGLSALFKEHVKLDILLDFVNKSGPLAPLVFCGIYLVGPTIFLPYSLLAIAGGALFGPVLGTIYTIVASTIGATVPFLISRKLGKQPLNKIIARSPNFDRQFAVFEKSVEEKGWKYVAFTRLVTLFPYLVLNYAFGLTKVGVWSYVWATFLFMLPVTMMYSYMGYAGREALAGGEDVAGKMSIAFACFVVLSCLPAVVGRLRRKP